MSLNPRNAPNHAAMEPDRLYPRSQPRDGCPPIGNGDLHPGSDETDRSVGPGDRPVLRRCLLGYACCIGASQREGRKEGGKLEAVKQFHE